MKMREAVMHNLNDQSVSKGKLVKIAMSRSKNGVIKGFNKGSESQRHDESDKRKANCC